MGASETQERCMLAVLVAISIATFIMSVLVYGAVLNINAVPASTMGVVELFRKREV